MPLSKDPPVTSVVEQSTPTIISPAEGSTITTTTTTAGGGGATSTTSSTLPSLPTVTIAIQGCCHGELGKIYNECSEWEDRNGGHRKKIDLLICCGDFQSLRTPDDFSSITLPEKYKVLGDFYLYYNGTRKAPIPTLFVGGNHEASNVLWREYYGGEVAPNIYYLGHSGAIIFKGLRIAGLSGIFKGHDYSKSYPVPPYSDGRDVYSAYHVRELEIKKLELYSKELTRRKMTSSTSSIGKVGDNSDDDDDIVDMMLSHDWPVGITDYGDVEKLLSVKPFFKEDISRKQLGNAHTLSLLRTMKPRRWFAAHLHVRFDASVPHLGSGVDKSKTTFLGLDKCVQRYINNQATGERERGESFLEVIEVQPAASNSVRFPPDSVQTSSSSSSSTPFMRDPVWVDVVQATHRFLSIHKHFRESKHVDLSNFPTDLSATVVNNSQTTDNNKSEVLQFKTSKEFEERLNLNPRRPTGLEEDAKKQASTNALFAKFLPGGSGGGSKSSKSSNATATNNSTAPPVQESQESGVKTAMDLAGDDQDDGLLWEEDVGGP